MYRYRIARLRLKIILSPRLRHRAARLVSHLPLVTYLRARRREPAQMEQEPGFRGMGREKFKLPCPYPAYDVELSEEHEHKNH